MYVTIGDVNQGQLVACNGCGTVAALRAAPGWRCFDLNVQHELSPVVVVHGAVGHHCPACVERNDLIRTGLTYGVDPATAVTYTAGEGASR